MNCAGFVVICKDEKKVLLVSTHKGKWGFPKGKKEKKESFEQCAFRELKEETGLRDDQIDPLDMTSTFFNEITKKGKPSVQLYLATTQNLIEPKIEDQDELSQAKWFDFEEAKKVLTIKNRKEILESAIETLSTITLSSTIG